MVQRRRRGNHRGPKPSHLRRPKSYKVLCSGCGKEVVTQVPAPNEKKLLCTECFNK
jgi:CxxC-x17-CxxC domain-containing protein